MSHNAEPARTIVLVEDVDDLRTVMADNLRLEGYRVCDYASLPADRLDDVITSDRPDILLLDVMLRDACGFDIARAVRENHPEPYIPIVYITGKNDAASRAAGFAAGGDDYIVKPVRMEELNYKLKALLRIKGLNDELNRVGKVREKMIYTIVHELRTPLTTIMGNNQTMLQYFGDLETDDQLMLLSAIEAESERMMHIVNSLLDISKFDSGKIKLAYETVNITALLGEPFSAIRQKAEEKEFKLAMDIADMDLEFACDPIRIKQVIFNFLGNAVKFTPRGGSITLGGVRKNGNVEIFVEDTGPGIPEDELPKVFVEFEQVSTKATGGELGSGLGLAIAKRIVESHKGDIGVRSQPGQGCTFYCCLPVETPTNA